MSIRISTRSRNIGFGWSCIPTGKGTEITKPTKPDVYGSLKAVEAEVKQMLKTCSGGIWYRCVLWVGGVEVFPYPYNIPSLLSAVRELQYVDVDPV